MFHGDGLPEELEKSKRTGGSIAEDNHTKLNHTHTTRRAVAAFAWLVCPGRQRYVADWAGVGLVAFGGAENLRVSEMRNLLGMAL